MKYSRNLTAGLILLTCSAYAQRDIYPATGVIASATEMASINYSCSKPIEDKANYRKIECEIYYETLKKGKSNIQKEVIEEEYKKKGIPTDMCMMFGKKNIINMTIPEVQAEVAKQDETRNSFNKQMIEEMTPILQRMCKEKTLESFQKFIEFTSNIESNTCEIESSKTKETFTELPQKSGERSIWISESAAIPPCGRKDIIKFLPTKGNEWSIQYEHLVLNKETKDEAGGICRSLDGVRNIFNSHSNTWKLPCKYIKLSNRSAWQGPFNTK